jgi:polysaccharide biosynthesis transport protein
MNTTVPRLNDNDSQVPPTNLQMDYLVVLHRRKWAAISVFIVVIACTAFYLVRIYEPPLPTYQATSKIVISSGALQNIVPATSSHQELDLVTQLEIIKTTPVLGKVIQRLNLSDAPEGTSAFKRSVTNLRNSLKVEFVGETLVVTITTTQPNPELARDIANGVAEAYIDYDRLSRLQTDKDAVAWLTEEIADIKTKLEKAEKAFQHFRQKTGIITLDLKQSEDAAELTKLNANYVSVKSKRIELEAVIDRLNTEVLQPTEILGSLLLTESLQSLNTRLVDLQRQYAEKRKIFKEAYPVLIELKAEIEGINRKLVDECEKQLKALNTQEEILRNAWHTKKSEVLSLREEELEYLNLEREVLLNRRLYDTLLMKVRDFTLVDNTDLSNIRILEYANLPTTPKILDRKKRIIGFGISFALMAAVGLPFLLEYVDRSLRTPDDVHRALGISVVGLVPRDKQLKHASAPRLVAVDGNSSATSEAYYTLGTNLLFSHASDRERAPQTLLVTSASPSEGKSMTAINLAAVLAQMDWRVLLVDADLRRPILHRVFPANRLKGLSAVFNEEVPLEDTIVKTTIPNLEILPAGPKPLNPAVILSSNKIKDILTRLKADYDFILIDSAPILGLADGVALANIVDGVLIVVKAGSTAAKPAEMLIKQLQQVDANLLGVVLNAVDLSQDRYYYYRYYYSYDYAGYGEDETPPKPPKRKKGRSRKRE